MLCNVESASSHSSEVLGLPLSSRWRSTCSYGAAKQPDESGAAAAASDRTLEVLRYPSSSQTLIVGCSNTNEQQPGILASLPTMHSEPLYHAPKAIILTQLQKSRGYIGSRRVVDQSWKAGVRLRLKGGSTSICGFAATVVPPIAVTDSPRPQLY